jgi:NTP pyrophosphatase (non-canonical NTP hydrolase)
MRSLIDKVIEWANARNLIDGSTSKDQLCKLIQEVGELSDNICKSRDIADDIGDILVVLIIIAEQEGYNLEGCLAQAYDEIKDRKGVMRDGIFIKDGDVEC